MGFDNGEMAKELTNHTVKAGVEVAKALATALKRDPRKESKKHSFEEKNPRAPAELMSFYPRGIFFGTQNGKNIVKPEELDRHVMIVGNPGTGKSSCIAIPTLRRWDGSVFAIDVKGELYEKTYRYRPNIKVFAPQKGANTPYGYDPYFALKESSNVAQEAEAIAQSLIPLPKEIKDTFWIEGAQKILKGAILHYFELDFSFIETLEKILSQNTQELINTIAKGPSLKAQRCVKTFVGIADTTLTSITTHLNNGIEPLVNDDNIYEALSLENVITPQDLERGHNIYIQIPEELLRQWKSLLTLIVNQFIMFFEKRVESTAQPVLMLLDEFPRMGKIPAITDALATLRSKKITICLIVQSVAQLDQIYGNDARKVVADTCTFKAVLGASDPETQKYFSDLTGTFDEQKITVGENRHAFTGSAQGTHISTAPHKEPRIKPEEFATLEEIILIHSLPPNNFCRVTKQPYYAGEHIA
jgi:type IV secretion system protein VirD4